MDDEPANLHESKPKTPVVRGARACTVCRTAKMRCVGADDGQKQCQRCKRQNLECIFEKHRRGRKPGSKLSEASKMLRRLEKGINTAKLKAQASSSQLPFPTSDSRTSASDGNFHMPHQSGESYSTSFPPYPASSSSSEYRAPYNNQSFSATTDHTLASPSQTLAEQEEEDEEDNDKDGDDALYPQRILAKENRNSFFGTILNPSDAVPRSRVKSEPNRGDGGDDATRRTASLSLRATPSEPVIDDPVSLGLLDEAEAKVLFDLVFLRLNPFINLFDPVLHTVNYVRRQCPLLFSCLLMAGCKFWKPELFKQCQKIAVDLSIRAFAENWKRVEVVQAFACLTYWKDPDDTRTWTYIGYACRMAVELGLNRFVGKPSEKETDTERRERRNRERTYLVLFVHDRSLSMQTGRQWMLPEDDLVRHSMTWHEDSFIRPEDVIVAAFVQLRRIAAETTDVFYLHKGGPGTYHADVNYEILLRGCNGKLTQWMDTWQHEMKRAGGQPFHFSMLAFFRLHVRLFLNSFGLQSSMASTSRSTPSLQALSACYTSALQTLQIITKEFAPIGMLRYTQESITVMTAYSAVFLLKLLRRTTTLTELNEGAAQKIYDLISQTADAYQEAAILAASSSSAAYHARFLRTLVAKDMAGKARAAERERKREAEEVRRTQPSSEAPLQSPTYNQSGQFRPQSHPPPGPNGGSNGGGQVNGQSQGGLHINVPVSLHQNPNHQSPPNNLALQPQQSPDGLQNHNNVLYQPQPMNPPQQDHSFHFPASPRLPQHPMVSPTDMNNDPFHGNINFIGNGGMATNGNGAHSNNNMGFAPMFGNSGNMTELDAHYWRNMFRELGFGGNIEPTVGEPAHMEQQFTEFPPQNFGQSASMGMLQ